MFLKDEFSNRLFQVSLFASIVYYITANPIVFEKVREYFPIKFKNTQTLLIFQTFVFAVLMYILTYFVFDPLMNVVEGLECKPGDRINKCEEDLDCVCSTDWTDIKRNPDGWKDNCFCESCSKEGNIYVRDTAKCSYQ